MGFIFKHNDLIVLALFCFLKLIFYFHRAKISYHSQPPGSQMLPPYLTEDKIAEMQKGFNLKKLEEENNATVQGRTCYCSIPVRAVVAVSMRDHE